MRRKPYGDGFTTGFTTTGATTGQPLHGAGFGGAAFAFCAGWGGLGVAFGAGWGGFGVPAWGVGAGGEGIVGPNGLSGKSDSIGSLSEIRAFNLNDALAGRYRLMSPEVVPNE